MVVSDLEDDGLPVAEVGDWGERKYNLIRDYAAMFATAMKRKWDDRVYLDLFAGPGRARLRNSGRVVDSSPLLALSVSTPFDLYVFCDIDGGKLSALRQRVVQRFPTTKALYVVGDANENVSSILGGMPKPSRFRKVLCFCVLDPFNLGNLRFSTVQCIAQRFVDFLVLIPSYMDANRNWREYEKEGNHTVDLFLGDQVGWRLEWAKQRVRRDGLGQLVVQRFIHQMATLNYGCGVLELVRLPGKNVPLYHLAGFSRHQLGIKFFQEAQQLSSEQGYLPFAKPPGGPHA